MFEMPEVVLNLLTPLNLGFAVTMILIFIISFFRITKNPKQETTLPSLLGALGIMGTFGGIFLGLMTFDSNHIDRSVPELLDGMKIAFFTSLIGLFLSNTLKGYKSYRIKAFEKKEGKDLSDVSLEKIADIMVTIEKSIRESNENLGMSIKELNENQKVMSEKNNQTISMMADSLVGESENSLTNQIKTIKTELIKSQVGAQNSLEKGLNKLVESLAGEEERTLTSQMKVMRHELVNSQNSAQERLENGLGKMENNLEKLTFSNQKIAENIESGNNTLIDEFRIFSKNMAENNMKAFTEAIQECIRDLNNQLQEQFGENFKHLNLAVEKLLEWQIHYKDTIETTNKTQEELYRGMDKAREMVIEINERSSKIVDIVNGLGNKIVTLETQEKTLTEIITSLNKISFDAKNLIPNLDEYLKLGMINFSEAITNVKTLTMGVKNSLNESSVEIEGYIKSSETKLMEHNIVASGEITAHIINTTQKAIGEVSKLSSVTNEKIVENMKKIEELALNLDINSTKSISNIEKYIKAADDKLMEHSKIASEEITTHVINTTQKGIEEINKSSIAVLSSVNSVNSKAIEEVSKLSYITSEKITESLKKIEELVSTIDISSAKAIFNIEKTSGNIQEEINKNSLKLNEVGIEVLSLVKLTTENLKKNQNEVIQSLSEVTQGIVSNSTLNMELIEKQLKGMEASVIKFENEGFTLTKRISDNIQNMVENNNSNLQTSVANLNTELESTLNSSLESLGNQLAAVSEKFVSDYTPLTVELQKLITIAKKVG